MRRLSQGKRCKQARCMPSLSHERVSLGRMYRFIWRRCILCNPKCEQVYWQVERENEGRDKTKFTSHPELSSLWAVAIRISSCSEYISANDGSCALDVNMAVSAGVSLRYCRILSLWSGTYQLCDRCFYCWYATQDLACSRKLIYLRKQLTTFDILFSQGAYWLCLIRRMPSKDGKSNKVSLDPDRSRAYNASFVGLHCTVFFKAWVSVQRKTLKGRIGQLPTEREWARCDWKRPTEVDFSAVFGLTTRRGANDTG